MSKFILNKDSVLFITSDNIKVVRFKLTEDKDYYQDNGTSLVDGTCKEFYCGHKIIDLNTDENNNVYILDEDRMLYRLEVDESGKERFIRKGPLY